MARPGGRIRPTRWCENLERPGGSPRNSTIPPRIGLTRGTLCNYVSLRLSMGGRLQTMREAPSQGTRVSKPAEVSNLFRAGDVVEIVQISRRQLQYWSQTDLIRPSAKTPGGHARYTFEDLVALKAAKRLIDAGVSVQRIRKSIRALRRTLPAVERPLTELILVATGDVLLAFKDGTAFDAISGQEWVFEVAEFQREVDEWRRTTQAADSPRSTRAVGTVDTRIGSKTA